MRAPDLSAPPASVRKRQIPKRLRKAAIFEQLGPGLITGAADDDPSGIATYSQAGAQFGFNMLWTMVLTYPLMTAVQLVSAQIGRVTGCGLAKNIGEILGKLPPGVKLIPGHGPLATRGDLIAWRGMIATAVDRVRTIKGAGRTLEQAKGAKPLAGLSNAPNGFVGEDAFVESIWGSLEAHAR